ncbi:MAG: aldo/keto reductase [Candidatus Roizmanbacteria bacterium]|nr:aldo/keto reductase [Candidatus Roizmanbacteria bacterium]
MKSSIKLNNNKIMPILGLGTWQSPKGSVGRAVQYALVEANYKHIDCASIYKNEKEIGSALHGVFSKRKIKRSDIFITSKLWNTEHNPKNVEKACKQTLKDLRLDYLDLYLVHWGIAFVHGLLPEPLNVLGLAKTENVPMQDTWGAMENLVKKGLVKSVGVANFTAPMLLDLFTYARIKPAVNQIEIHPYNSQQALVEYCKKMKVAITAYSPLGSTGKIAEKPLSDPTVIRIAHSHKKTPAQVLIRWLLQREIIAIPKSTKTNRIDENSEVFDFALSAKEMKSIYSLNKNKRFVDPSMWWGVPYFQ